MPSAPIPNSGSFAGRLRDLLKKLDPASGGQAAGNRSGSTAFTPAPRPDAPEKGPLPADAPRANPVLRSDGPAGQGPRAVRQGDCITSLAGECGHLAATIWDDPANSALRAQRSDSSILLPHDRVYIPELRQKREPGQTQMRHRFRRLGQPARLRLVLKNDDLPIANEPYLLEIEGGAALRGVSSAEGRIEQTVPSGAKRAKLTLERDGRQCVLEIGSMDPVGNLAGVQKRLTNLGFDCRRQDGVWDEACAAAVRAFQKSTGLPVTGDPDEATRARLEQAHGC